MLEASQSRGAVHRAVKIAGRHRATVAAAVIALLVAALLLFVLQHTASQPPVHQAPVITMVVIQPPKPPPPPPPLPQPKMITQPKETVPEQKPMIPNQPPKAAPPKPAGPSAPTLGTSIHNNGPADGFNLGGTPGGGCIVCGSGGGGGGGSYAGAVAADIEAALASNPVTRFASAGLRVRIWVNANGIVARVALDKSSGNPAVDTAINNQILPGMQLPQPPSGTPMPMLVSLTGTQPL